MLCHIPLCGVSNWDAWVKNCSERDADDRRSEVSRRRREGRGYGSIFSSISNIMFRGRVDRENFVLHNKRSVIPTQLKVNELT